MTDEEMALEIGNKITSLRRQNAALRGILNACRIQFGVPLDWRPLLDEQLKESDHSAQERTEWLEKLIDNRDQHTSLVHTVHQHMLHPTEWD
jgi:hypothetical protein